MPKFDPASENRLWGILMVVVLCILVSVVAIDGWRVIKKARELRYSETTDTAVVSPEEESGEEFDPQARAREIAGGEYPQRWWRVQGRAEGIGTSVELVVVLLYDSADSSIRQAITLPPKSHQCYNEFVDLGRANSGRYFRFREIGLLDHQNPDSIFSYLCPDGLKAKELLAAREVSGP